MEAFPFYFENETTQEVFNVIVMDKGYVISQMTFELLMPKNGEIMSRTIEYKTGFKAFFPLKMALTELVLKHSPGWYCKEEYRKIPVKVISLTILSGEQTISMF
jgi:hypothetical protein